MRKFGLSADDANFVNSLLYIISTIASPLLGLLVDKTGWNLFWVFISICSTIGAHALLAFTFVNPYYAMVSNSKKYLLNSKKSYARVK